MVLPHNRVGGDFSWLQGAGPREAERRGRAPEGGGGGPPLSAASVLGAQQRLHDPPRGASALLDSSECEKIKSILRCLDPPALRGAQPEDHRRVLTPAMTPKAPAGGRSEPGATSFAKGEPLGSGEHGGSGVRGGCPPQGCFLCVQVCDRCVVLCPQRGGPKTQLLLTPPLLNTR